MKKVFLDLGKQPITNKFLGKEEFNGEFFYNLKVVFDEETKLVSIQEFVQPEIKKTLQAIWNSIATSLESDYYLLIESCL